MAFDIFLKFSGTVSGGPPLPEGGVTSPDQALNGAFEVMEYTFGTENPTTVGSATGGAGTGKARFRQLTIKKAVDGATPSLFRACASGGHFNTATLTIRRAGSNASNLIYTFRMVFVSSITWPASSGDDAPGEEVNFAYGAMQLSYAQARPDGSLAAPRVERWNVVTNTPTIEVPNLP
jgi:type VI secretion system secreted protein Hcp